MAEFYNQSFFFPHPPCLYLRDLLFRFLHTVHFLQFSLHLHLLEQVDRFFLIPPLFNVFFKDSIID